jgi:hypothetical protein
MARCTTAESSAAAVAVEAAALDADNRRLTEEKVSFTAMNL